MSESKKLDQSNTDSTAFQSNIENAQQTIQAEIVHIHNGERGANGKKHIPALEDNATPPSKNGKSITFLLEGSIDDITPADLAKLQSYLKALKSRTKDVNLIVTEIKEGSIILKFEGSEENIEELKRIWGNGEMSSLLNKKVVRKFEHEQNNSSEDLSSKKDVIKPLLSSKIRSNLFDRKNRNNLQEVDLSKTNLEGANLEGANLEGANLEGANLEGANLRGSYLAAANLAGANLMKTILGRADLEEATLNEAELFEANLTKSHLERASLKYANLARGRLASANLEGANLEGANLKGATLEKASLRGAILARTILVGTNVENAIFTDSRGLTEQTKADLIARGAIFEDSPGSPSGILEPVHR